jgi:hypothetical protein
MIVCLYYNQEMNITVVEVGGGCRIINIMATMGRWAEATVMDRVDITMLDMPGFTGRDVTTTTLTHRVMAI